MKYNIELQIPDQNTFRETEYKLSDAIRTAPRIGALLMPNQWKVLRDTNGEVVGKITRTE